MNTNLMNLKDALKQCIAPLFDDVSERPDPKQKRCYPYTSLYCWVNTPHLGCSVEIFINEHCISVMHRTSMKTTDSTSTFRRLLIELQKALISILPTSKWYMLKPCTCSFSSVGFTTEEHLNKALVKTISDDLFPAKNCITECFFSPSSTSDSNLQGCMAFSNQLWEFVITRFMQYVDLQPKACDSINTRNDKNGNPKCHYFSVRWGGDSNLSIMVEVYAEQIVLLSNSSNIGPTFNGWSFVSNPILEYLKTCPNQWYMLKLPEGGCKMTTTEFLAEVWPDDSKVLVSKII